MKNNFFLKNMMITQQIFFLILVFFSNTHAQDETPHPSSIESESKTFNLNNYKFFKRLRIFPNLFDDSLKNKHNHNDDQLNYHLSLMKKDLQAVAFLSSMVFIGGNVVGQILSRSALKLSNVHYFKNMLPSTSRFLGNHNLYRYVPLLMGVSALGVSYSRYSEKLKKLTVIPYDDLTQYPVLYKKFTKNENNDLIYVNPKNPNTWVIYITSNDWIGTKYHNAPDTLLKASDEYSVAYVTLKNSNEFINELSKNLELRKNRYLQELKELEERLSNEHLPNSDHSNKLTHNFQLESTVRRKYFNEEGHQDFIDHTNDIFNKMNFESKKIKSIVFQAHGEENGNICFNNPTGDDIYSNNVKDKKTYVLDKIISIAKKDNPTIIMNVCHSGDSEVLSNPLSATSYLKNKLGQSTFYCLIGSDDLRSTTNLLPMINGKTREVLKKYSHLVKVLPSTP